MCVTYANVQSSTLGGKGLGKAVQVLKDPKKISKMLKKLQKVLPWSFVALSMSPSPSHSHPPSHSYPPSHSLQRHYDFNVTFSYTSTILFCVLLLLNRGVVFTLAALLQAKRTKRQHEEAGSDPQALLRLQKKVLQAASNPCLRLSLIFLFQIDRFSAMHSV
jgi:hypothetical protein